MTHNSLETFQGLISLIKFTRCFYPLLQVASSVLELNLHIAFDCAEPIDTATLQKSKAKPKIRFNSEHFTNKILFIHLIKHSGESIVDDH